MEVDVKMLTQTIKITKEFIKFINQCFGNADFEHQHNQYQIGEYPLSAFIEVYDKYTSDEWVFDHNCHDCSFPKFRNIKTGKVETCPLCGD